MGNFRICNLKDNKQYCREIAILEHNEWGETYENMEEFNEKIDKKVEKMEELFDNPSFYEFLFFLRHIALVHISDVTFVAVADTEFSVMTIMSGMKMRWGMFFTALSFQRI